MLPEHLQTLSIETSSLGCEDQNTSIEREYNEFADGITVANQEATKPSNASPINTKNTVQILGFSEFMTEGKNTTFEGEVDISDLLAIELNENEPLLNETSDSSTLLNLATTPESSLIQNSDFDSGNETFSLDSLFEESEITTAISASIELEFYDLFEAPEEPEESLNPIEKLTLTSLTENAYLFNFLEEEPEAQSQTEIESEEFCFSLDSGENIINEFPLLEISMLSITESDATTNPDLESSISDSLSNTEEFSTTFDLAEALTSQTLVESIDDEFDDLEKLLTEIPAVTTVADTAPQQAEIDEFSQLEALLEPDGAIASVTQAGDDEFDDLEKLLEEIPSATTVVDTAPQEIDEFSQLEALLEPDTPAVAPVTPAVVPSTDKTTNGSPTFKPNQAQATASDARRAVLEQTMRVPVKHLDNVSNLVGELVVNRNSLEQDQQRLRQSLDNLLHQVQQLNGLGSRMQELYERSLMEASLINIRQGSQSASLDQAAASFGRHATGMDFDALEMDRFTGFHTLSQEMIELIVRVREASSDIEFVTDETEQVARQFRQVTTQLQEGLTRSRMVPFGEIADRLPRAVRDISLKYGKQVELHIEGRETLIDKMLLQQLYDPMTHLVNNSITHGIETPDQRTAKGKPPIGKITIRAFYQGNQTVIAVGDDGAGIDTDRVMTKAIQKGLITIADARAMSRLDTYNLLFHPGFSMKDHADQYAGRGVGMDVVRTSLSEIRGTISTDSTLGKGTTFTIRLPLTLSICKVLCCVSEKAQIAFPMDGVEEMMEIPTASVVLEEGQSCIFWRDSLLPLRPLKELLTYNRQVGRGNVYGINREDDRISIVVLRSAGTFMAIQVDQVIGEQEIVIKQFEAPAPKPIGVAGATVMGDGRIMPIADVLELIGLAMGRIERESMASALRAATPVMPEIPDVKTEPMVLIVDDSITVRELLSMTFNQAGYRVEQARDGQEAWDKLRDGLPCNLVFCDIEMPRMDGLELLSRLQKDPNLSQLPIAMLTSRGADRHRQMAIQLGARGYFTKPYLEEALLDGAQKMLNGEVLVASSSNV